MPDQNTEQVPPPGMHRFRACVIAFQHSLSRLCNSVAALPAIKRLREELQGERKEQYRAILKMGLVGAVLLFIIDPFNLQEMTLAASGYVSDRLDAARYTAPSANRIAVVTVDDATLTPDHPDWPPSFPFWSDLLGMLQLHHPAAVYFDLSFDYPRPSYSTPADAGFAPASDAEREAGEEQMFAEEISGALAPALVPVVLGTEGRLAVQRGRLTGCANPARNGEWTSVRHILACAAEETVFFDYPMPPDHRGYPLWTEWSSNNDIAPSRTPAVALADLSCTALHPAPIWCGSAPPGWLKLSSLQKRAPGDAVIPSWSFYASNAASPENAVNGGGCRRYLPGTPFTRNLHWLMVLAGDSLAGPAQHLLPERIRPFEEVQGTNRQPCLPFPVISAAYLFDHSGTNAQALDAVLRNRIVLIGDGREYSLDRIESPLHGYVPGVVFQATVLETLLTKGRNFPEISDPLRKRRSEVELATRIGILVLAMALDFAAFHLRDRLRTGPDQNRRRVRLGLMLCGAREVAWENKALQSLRWVFNRAFSFIFVLAGTAIVLATRNLAWAPPNWVFLITEMIVIAFSLGEIKAPGLEKKPEKEEEEKAETKTETTEVTVTVTEAVLVVVENEAGPILKV